MAPRTGSTNRNKQFLLNRLQEMYGDDFHPIMKMAHNASTLQERVEEQGESAETSDILDANKAWGAIAEYTEPKLRSIEVDGSVNLGLSDLSDVELERKLKRLERIRAQSAEA